MALVPCTAWSAGVTVITHGFNSSIEGWILGMAGSLPPSPQFPGTNVICYELRVTSSGAYAVSVNKIAGGNPLADFNAEIVIKLDWSDLAGFFDQHSTVNVAAAVVPSLLQTDLIAELNGHALAELPIHLIGHSRGGSMVCELAKGLGVQGVWVDQITLLDPHPVNNDGNPNPLLSVVDAPLRVYENVLFADNYYQDFGGYPHGQAMPHAYNRRLTSLPGGYASAHSDMHLWYHATIDLFDPADDTEALLFAADRAQWFTAYEQGGWRAGYHYSRAAGGNRLSTDTPAGAGTDAIVKGFNQRWDFGANGVANRVPLPANNARWANPIQVRLSGTNLMALGQTNSLTLHYQYARPLASNALVRLYLDNDYNPLNGNEQSFRQNTAPGTTSNQVALATLNFGLDPLNATPGVHSLLVEMSEGPRRRYAYAPQLLTVFSSWQRPQLSISRATMNRVAVEVRGVAGQRAVLETTSTFASWQSVATNWLGAAPWTYLDTLAGGAPRFYRAVLR